MNVILCEVGSHAGGWCNQECVPDDTSMPVVRGIDGPASLNIGQIGTWTVSASVPNQPGAQLNYSVQWGDEASVLAPMASSPVRQTLQTSAFFTHAYQYNGTYKPKFTVSNSAGSASAGMMVTVGGQSVPEATPFITVINPNGGSYWYRGSGALVEWKTGGIPQDNQMLIRLRSIDTKQEYDLATVHNSGSAKIAIPTTVPVGAYNLEIKTAVNNQSYMDSSDSYLKVIDMEAPTIQPSIPMSTLQAFAPMTLRDIQKIISVSPYGVANLSFGISKVSAQYNLGAYHNGQWYEGQNPGITGPVWVEFNWPNQSFTDVVLTDENGRERKIYLPSTGANANSAWYYWIGEDGASYYANTSHGPGGFNLSSNQALIPEHVARKANNVSVPATPIISTTPEQIATAATITSSLIATALTSITISGTASPVGSSVYITVVNGSSTASALVLANGTWSATFSAGFPTGTYPITIRASSLDGPILTTGNVTVSQTTPTPTITIVSPNGGETYTVGDTVTVRWLSTDASRIYLALTDSAGNEVMKNLVNIDGNPGQTTWPIPDYTTPGQYWLKASVCVPNNVFTSCDDNTSNHTLLATDMSNSYFTIVPLTATSSASSTSYNYSQNQMAGALSAIEGLTSNNSASRAQAGFTYTWNRDIQIGSPYFEDVKALQTALTREGVYTGETTGGFYNQTFWAVKDFQQKYDIEATGFVGPLTRTKLNELYVK